MRVRTSPSVLVVLAVVAGLAVNLIVRAAYDALPSLPAPAGVSLLVLGIAEIGMAVVLRARIRGRGRRPVDPLVAARAVALAKASSVAGSIVGGGWAGILAAVAPRAGQLSAAASDTVSAVVGLISAVVLVGAALGLEYCCRTPDDRDDDPRHPDGSRRDRGHGGTGPAR